MRELLFRGKHVLSGDWVEGDLTHTTTGYRPVIQSHVNGQRPRVVEDETVGQYTGMKDKQGKRIFEGDIHQRETRKRGL